ncbi:MAG: adenosine deaminase [Vicinamibacteria bacterium]|nr:adenosine deaminase [Vicinamibacteria bacterium]
MPENFAAWPKAEVHLHLEGTVSPETLWDLASRNGVALPAASLDELRAHYAFDGFDRFLTLWLAMCNSLRHPRDYEEMVDGYLAACRRQNVRYVEAHFTPYNHERFGFGGRRALEIVCDRLRAAEAAGGPVTRLILDIPSESVPESGPYTIGLLEQIAEPLVVAIGLGGPEEGFPRSLVAPHFERARAAGYPCVAHAGETAGAAFVREAVELLKVRRVQHGIRVLEDPALVRLLAEREICCDVALTSNTLLTIHRDLPSHPLPALLAAGVPCTLSTDDPPFFGTDLVREYQQAHDVLGLSPATLWEMNLNGLRFGLADTALRRRLLLEFAAWRQEHP